MRAGTKILVAAAILGGIVVVGIVVGSLAGRAPQPGSAASPQRTNTSRPDDHTPFTYVARNSTPAASNRSAGSPVAAAPIVTNAATAETNAAPTWEDLIDDILQANTDDATQMKQLLALYPQVPEEGQVEVAQHLANLASDQDYGPVRQILTNAETPEDVTDVLLADVLNRPNAIKLPTLLDIARNPQHPNAEEAKDLLSLYLDEDYGDAWNRWQQAMETWLKENPD